MVLLYIYGKKKEMIFKVVLFQVESIKCVFELYLFLISYLLYDWLCDLL